jgi:nucleoside-diphosphate-sugar epimerase
MNIGCGNRTTINALYGELSRLLHVTAQPEYVDPRPGDVKHSLADLTRAHALLGYKPKVNIKTGLKRVVAAFQTPIR